MPERAVSVYDRIAHEELAPDQRLSHSQWYTLVALTVLEGPFGDTDREAFHIRASWRLLGIETD